MTALARNPFAAVSDTNWTQESALTETNMGTTSCLLKRR